MELREPQEIAITDTKGIEHKFILSMFPAWDGLEIQQRIPSGCVTLAIPKLSDWDSLGVLKKKILKYIAVEINGQYIPLITQELVDNHVPDSECLFKLLDAEVKYNNSFFQGATLSDFLAEACRVAIGKLSEILTQSSEQSSLTGKPPSTN